MGGPAPGIVPSFFPDTFRRGGGFFLVMFLSGCSLFRSSAGVATNPTAPDTVVVQESGTPDSAVVSVPPPAVRPAPKSAAPAEPPPEKPPTPPADTPPTDAAAPVLTVRIPPDQEAELVARLSSDVHRATEALNQLRGYALGPREADEKALAEDFLKRSLAARSSDLVRAGTLAEKARVLAEELKVRVVK